MTIYIVQVVLILLMGVLLKPSVDLKGRKWFLLLSFVLLASISGIRGYSVGADTKVYVNLYENIDSIRLMDGRFETGFIIYLNVLHRIMSNPRFLLLVSSMISIGTVTLFTYYYSKEPTISILLYVLLGQYFSQMNTMRQALALSITLLAFMINLSNKEKFRFPVFRYVISGLLLIVAIGFHSSSYVAFIPWLLMINHGEKEELTNLKIRIVIFRTFFIAVVLFVTYSLIMRITMAVLPVYSAYFQSTWSDSNYFASLLKSLISMVFLICGAAILRKRRLTNLQRFSAIMLGLCIAFQVLSMRMEIWGRVVGFFEIYSFLLWIPEFLSELHLINNKRIIEGGIIGFSFLYMIIVLTYRPEWTMVVPYVIG